MKFPFLCLLYSLLASNCSFNTTKNSSTNSSEESEIIEKDKGLQGYISYYLPKTPKGYGAGISFYSAVWPLVEKPLANFQIGLPSTWIIPENSEVNFPLCPEGSLARNWEERGPSWSSVFQTVEGGIGYWRGNRFRYPSPKFSMNGVPSCYDYEVASPGWPFFHSSEPLADDKMGIAQLTNRLVIPPDGITFQGSPNGQFLGYAWMSLPLMEAKTGKTPRGDQSWTLFLNTTNFKGAVAYYIAETWTKIASEYERVTGHTLDVKPGVAGSGAMEINTVPQFQLKTTNDSLFTKIPALNFPVDAKGNSILVQDVKLYSKEAIFNTFRNWKNNNMRCSGKFNIKGSFSPILDTRKTSFKQEDKPIQGMDNLLHTEIFSDNEFGIAWKEHNAGSTTTFPQYFLDNGNNERIPISEAQVPKALAAKEFALAARGEPYEAPMAGAWVSPGPASKPHKISLEDGSIVTYCWYRFIDQPALQQFNWSLEEKNKLQTIIEKIHTHWNIENDFMTPLKKGDLVTIDNALLVTPPKGYEVGFVPIVIKQE